MMTFGTPTMRTRLSPFASAVLVILLSGLFLACESTVAAGANRVPVGAYPGALAVGDLNGDGLADLVVARTDAASISLLFGDGQGDFEEAPGSPFPAGNSPEDLVLSDFNKDKRLDVAIANHETDYVTVLLGRQLSPSGASPIRVESHPHPHGVTAGNFDGDGCPDLAVESRDENAVLVLLGDCRGGFALEAERREVGTWPYYHLRSADLNGDGLDDIVTTNIEGSSVSVLLGSNGDQRVATHVEIGGAPFALAIGDISGDGQLDLVVAHRRGSMNQNDLDGLTVLLGDGTGAFPEGSISRHSAGKSPTAVAIGDYDGDGIGDVAVVNQGSDDVGLFLGGRAGIQEARGSPFEVGSLPQAVALSDLNGDGRADIVTGNPGSRDISVLLSPEP